MMHDRELRDALQTLQDVQARLHAAILAETTSDMTTHGGEAQAAAVRVKEDLDSLLRDGMRGQSREAVQERAFATAARNCVSQAIVDAQRLALGTSVTELRAGLLRVKTQLDLTQAYVQAALGLEAV